MAEAMNDLPPFPGIRDDGLAFLEALKDEKHQDRDWFNERKSTYTDELRWPLRCLVADVVRRLESISGVALYGDPRSSVFRIYRDVRFSHDKRPYQTHAACKLTVDPALRGDDGVVYLHVEPPANSFLAAGIYAPAVKRLRPIRTEIVRAPSRWKEVVERLAAARLSPESHGDDLKGMPRGFADFRDHELAEYLKWTSFLVVEKLSRADVQSPSLAGRIVAFSQRAWPLLQFIREAR